MSFHRLAENHWDNVRAEDPHCETMEAAALLGQFLAQLSISASLERIAAAAEKLAGIAPATSLNLHVTDTPRKELSPMPPIAPVSLDTNHDLALAASPKDAGGNPVPDTLSWSSSNTAALTVTPAADGLSALAITVAAGTATVTVTDGVNTDSQDVTVTAGAAVSLGLTSSVVAKVPA